MHSFDRESERAPAGGTGQGEEEADSPVSTEPNVGLDPKTLRIRPEPKADAQPSQPPRCPQLPFCKGSVTSTAMRKGSKSKTSGSNPVTPGSHSDTKP